MSTIDQLRRVLAAPAKRESGTALVLAWAAVWLVRGLAAAVLLAPVAFLVMLLR